MYTMLNKSRENCHPIGDIHTGYTDHVVPVTQSETYIRFSHYHFMLSQFSKLCHLKKKKKYPAYIDKNDDSKPPV